MTIQELSDILGMRLRCNECSTEILVPFDREIRVKKFRTCPHCNAAWTTNGTSIENAIEEAMQTVRVLANLLQGGGFRAGFSLTLEIKPETCDDKD
jgi:DNA-directed RNA polymerase subunit RPC12/RpoP